MANIEHVNIPDGQRHEPAHASTAAANTFNVANGNGTTQYRALNSSDILAGGGLANPMTTAGDIIVGSTGGAPTRLSIGSPGQTLTSTVSGSVAWASASVSVVSYGADPTGATDSTAAFNNALASFTSGGGTVKVPPGNYLINAGNLTIPRNVTLSGSVGNVGEQLASPNQARYDTTGATLFLGSAYTIYLYDSSSINGLYILNQSLKGALPFASGSIASAAVSAFTGTAITAAGPDVLVENCWIGGFAQGFYSTGFTRTKINWVSIDCTNGVWVDTSTDIARIENVHCLGFLTIDQSWSTAAINSRRGSAFKVTTSFNTGMFNDCSSNGWNIGFDIEAGETINITNCFADGGNLGTSQIGFSFTGTADLVSVVGGGSSGMSTGLYVSTPSPGETSGNIALRGMTFWGNAAHINSLQHNILDIENCTFRDTNASPNTAITIGSGVTGQTQIHDNYFLDSTTAFSIATGVPFRESTLWGNRFSGVIDTIGERRVGESQYAGYSTHEVYTSGAYGPQYNFRSARGTAATPTISQTGDPLFNILGQGYDGANWQSGGGIRAVVEGTPSSGVMPSKIIFSANPGSGLVDYVVLDETGNLYPVTTNSYSLGGPSAVWSNVYATNANISNLLFTTQANNSPATNGEVVASSTQNALVTNQGGLVGFLSETLFTGTASVTSSGTTAVSMLPTGVGTLTIPANYLVAGSTLRIKLYGTLTTAASPGTLTFSATLGSSTIWTTGALTPTASLSAVGVEVDMIATVHTTGSSGTMATIFKWTYYSGGSSYPLSVAGSASEAINTTVSNVIGLTSTNSVSGGAVWTVNNAFVEILP
jgi:hypothetical protein